MFVYYINVPLNEDGMKEMESFSETMENVKTFELTEEMYLTLRKKGGLFDIFDSELGTLIDVCEEERIENHKLEMALALAKKYKNKKQNEDEKIAYNIILSSLTMAINAKTYWEIDIYLE